MGALGYNGASIYVVKDVVKDSILCQSGSSYYLKHEVFLKENKDTLMDDMEDTCQYVYWWNHYLYKEQ